MGVKNVASVTTAEMKSILRREKTSFIEPIAVHRPDRRRVDLFDKTYDVRDFDGSDCDSYTLDYCVADIVALNEEAEGDFIVFEAYGRDGFIYQRKDEGSSKVHYVCINNVSIKRVQEMTMHDLMSLGLRDEEWDDDTFEVSKRRLVKKFIESWDASAADAFKYENNPYVIIYGFGVSKNY